MKLYMDAKCIARSESRPLNPLTIVMKKKIRVKIIATVCNSNFYIVQYLADARPATEFFAFSITGAFSTLISLDFN